MRVLFLIRSLETGGAEHQLVTLARGLRAAGHEPGVAVFYSGGSLESDLHGAGIPLYALEKRGRWDVGFMRRLVLLVRRLRPDIVHPYLAVSNKVAAALRPFLGGSRVVWGVRSAFMDLRRYDWLTRASYRLEPWLSPLADAIVLNSRAGAEHARKVGFHASRLAVVPNGIDCQRFRPDEAGRERWRSRWGARPENLVVGVVGRLDPMKDHATFLRAAGAIAPRHPRVVFACVGDGPEAYRRELEELGRKLGLGDRIRWEHGTRDVQAVYAALDLLALSSYGESFPNVVAEAMACATPCLVTDVGDAADIVGDTGLVVPPSSTEALAAGLERALSWDDEERRRRGGAARARVEASYSVAALVRSSLDVFERVLEARRRAG